MSASTTSTQPQPESGMRRIPLPTQSYEHDSKPLDAAMLLNLFAENQPGDARSDRALISTPGLIPWQQLGSGPIRAINGSLQGVWYVISGPSFYRISFPLGGPFIVTYLGEVGNPVPYPATAYPSPTIAVGTEAVTVCVPPNAWTANHSDNAIVQLGGTFPGNAQSVCYLNGYFIFTSSNPSSQFFICGLMDPTAFDSLDFAYADGAPNILTRGVAHRGDVWFFGEDAIEVWYNSGDQDFPFRKRPGGVIARATFAPESIAAGDGSLWWYGSDGIVYRTSGYDVQRVSTYAIERILHLAWVPATNKVGMFYSQGGHAFYVITAGTYTLVYDAATQLWHNRSSSPDGTPQAWRVSAMSDVNDIPLCGDSRSGVIFMADLYTETEGNLPVRRQFITPPLWAATRRAFCSRLEIEMEVGAAPLPTGDVMLEWSDDGGFSWTGGPRTLNSGASFDRRKRVYATRLGSFRQRMYRVTTQHRVTVYAVDADTVAGAS